MYMFIYKSYFASAHHKRVGLRTPAVHILTVMPFFTDMGGLIHTGPSTASIGEGPLEDAVD